MYELLVIVLIPVPCMFLCNDALLPELASSLVA